MDEPALHDLAFLSDRHGGALLDAEGAVAWLCLPRLDAGSFCAKLLDRERGGHVTIAPAAEHEPPERRYLDASLVLETTWRTAGGCARVLDLLAIDPELPERPAGMLVRICEGVEGEVELDVAVAGRFDYGSAHPWIRPAGEGAFRLTAGDDGFLAWSDAGLEREGEHVLAGRVVLREGERRRLVLRYHRPPELDDPGLGVPGAPEADEALERTLAYWKGWSAKLTPHEGANEEGVLLSARVLHGLSNAASGAIAAAATTSLPESSEGRTWEYRASWVRDSVFASRSLAEVGCPEEADAFHRFILRTAAGSAAELRIMYGLGGERRLPEVEVDELRGWRGIGPVRVGNAAATQDQHDVLGELLALVHRRWSAGGDVDADEWRFLRAVVDRAAERWRGPDAGLWEWRGEPRHFVHSKALCWAALDRGIELAEALSHDAPLERWRGERDAAREAIERRGVDERGVFLQAFGHPELDAAALLLPVAGFCAWDDPRMVATADAIREELGQDGLLRRYRLDDGLPGEEHPFLACTFWLVECLARQGRGGEAREAFERALRCRTPLGLFAEQADPRTGEPWGNIPQALTHLAHVAAAQALAECATPAAPSA